jgi:hypothetical protein|tara:strand:- start:894 stop:1025 length:132 start_codon:yes stop_codon:yes gene_type:complete
VRHRLVRFWPVLWQTFGLRPMDTDALTLGEVLTVEHYCATLKS